MKRRIWGMRVQDWLEPIGWLLLALAVLPWLMKLFYLAIKYTEWVMRL